MSTPHDSGPERPDAPTPVFSTDDNNGLANLSAGALAPELVAVLTAAAATVLGVGVKITDIQPDASEFRP